MSVQTVEQEKKDKKSYLFHLGLGLTFALATKQQIESFEREKDRVTAERSKLSLMDQPMDAGAFADERCRIGSPVNSLSNAFDCACLLFGEDDVKQALQQVLKEKAIDPNSVANPPKVESLKDFVKALQWVAFTFGVEALENAAHLSDININRPELDMPLVEKPDTYEKAVTFLVQLHDSIWKKDEDRLNPARIDGWGNPIAKQLTKKALQMVFKLIKSYPFCVTTCQFGQSRPGYIIYDCGSPRILLVIDTCHIKVSEELTGDSGIKHVFEIFKPLLFEEANLARLKHQKLDAPQDVKRYLY